MTDTPDLPFVSARFAEHLKQPTPKNLYHYTTQDGLLGIVASGSLWATDITYLNDATEILLPLGLIRERLSDKLGDTKEIRRGTFPSALEYARATNTTWARANAFWQLAMSLRGSPTSVICFCEQGDLLSQWRGYTGGGYGYSLGFIPDTLKTIASGSGFILGRCIYDPDLQKQVIAECVEYLITAANAEFNYEEEDRFWSVMTCCAFFKHSSFEQEQEWRLVSTFFSGNHKRYNFRKGKSMLIPYETMPITGPDNVVIDDLIDRAYVGPCPHMALSKRSAEQLLVSNKIYARVYPSSIPFRDW